MALFFNHQTQGGAPIEMSAPCRIDMGGTIDMAVFHYLIGVPDPLTFNIALNLKTRVRVSPNPGGRVRVISKGFDSAEFPLSEAPFDHPLGLMFAMAGYFDAEGVSIDIESASPPRSALGGSSVAAVALAGAFLKLKEPEIALDDLKERAARIAFQVEMSIAGGPCGIQDHLAAAYGGVHAWYFRKDPWGVSFDQVAVAGRDIYGEIEKRLLIAYCGEPHESLNVNSRWVRQFLSGVGRNQWREIVSLTQAFVSALKKGDFKPLYPLMNRETEIRRRMTPDVLDEIGARLVDSAQGLSCGVRFTGAGGGGCVWALCESEERLRLKERWEVILRDRKSASLLDAAIDPDGLTEG